METKKITACRACGYTDDLEELYSLGNQWVNDFVNDPSGRGRLQCPIEIVLCKECGLVQQRYTAPQELLYSGNYWYKSGTTETMRHALRDVTKTVERRFGLRAGDTVLDIGSNDGTLLRSYTIPGIMTVGVEPAINLRKEGAVGINRLIDSFWYYNTYISQVGHKAKVITALGMLYDLDDPATFIRDVAFALRDDGVFITQLMCLQNMMDLQDVGNLCHEHLEFYTLSSLDRLLRRFGLEIFDIETNDVNGQSYRLYIRHIVRATSLPTNLDLDAAFRNEDKAQLDKPSTHKEWWDRIEYNRQKLTEFLADESVKGKRIWVYGASTKGNTILQWLLNGHVAGSEINIEGAADKADWKHGKYTVGTGIKIWDELTMRKAMPDYCLVLPYAFIDEFVERENDQAWRRNGGKFIVPLPKVEIV